MPSPLASAGLVEWRKTSPRPPVARMVSLAKMSSTSFPIEYIGADAGRWKVDVGDFFRVVRQGDEIDRCFFFDVGQLQRLHDRFAGLVFVMEDSAGRVASFLREGKGSVSLPVKRDFIEEFFDQFGSEANELVDSLGVAHARSRFVDIFSQEVGMADNPPLRPGRIGVACGQHDHIEPLLGEL